MLDESVSITPAGSEAPGSVRPEGGSGVLHLILGDSIAAYLSPPLEPGHQVINLAVSGNTWLKEEVLITNSQIRS